MGFPSLYDLGQLRGFKLLCQHPYSCRIFFELWCLSLLHHAPIRIEAVRVFHPAGEKEQGHRGSPKTALACPPVSFPPLTEKL